MATDIALDANHDIVIEPDDINLIQDEFEVLQSVKIRLLFIQTEWIFDYTRGVPWFDEMFDVATSKAQKEKNIKVAILNTQNVRQITEFNFGVDPVNKGALVEYSANTTYGPIEQRLAL
jgi:hypothetical protein